jgi:hypothetical protein
MYSSSCFLQSGLSPPQLRDAFHYTQRGFSTLSAVFKLHIRLWYESIVMDAACGLHGGLKLRSG